MGIIFGTVIFFAALSLKNSVKNSLLTYLAVYLPVRFVEWLMIVYLIKPAERGAASF